MLLKEIRWWPHGQPSGRPSGQHDSPIVWLRPSNEDGLFGTVAENELVVGPTLVICGIIRYAALRLERGQYDLSDYVVRKDDTPNVFHLENCGASIQTTKGLFVPCASGTFMEFSPVCEPIIAERAYRPNAPVAPIV